MQFNFIPSNFKSFDSSFNTFFHIKFFLSLIPKLGPIPCIYYTFFNARNCIDTKFYNKLK